MASLEKGAHFRASPEDFGYGREVMWSFSPDNEPDKEPDYDEMINRGRRRLLEAIENGDESDENIVFSAETQTALKDKKQNHNPWEPFNLEPNPNQKFVNLYSGPFSQQMELNRANADRLLDVAGIQGQIILTDVPMDRSRGIAGINSDGSVTKRRGLFWGEKLEEDQSQALVKPTPDGWRIEIPGQEIIEELSRQESKTPLDKRFTGRFNQVIRDSIREIIFREKLTTEKDVRLSSKAILSAMPLFNGILNGSVALINDSIILLLTAFAFPLVMYGITNKKFPIRTLKDRYEYIMPFVEIDRYIRGVIFTKNKGRNLVRLAAR